MLKTLYWGGLCRVSEEHTSESTENLEIQFHCQRALEVKKKA